MKENITIRGMVTVRVLGKDGNVKRRHPGWFRRLLKLQGRLMVSCHHNIITRQGDALIADALLASPRKVKLTSDNGIISVGNGWNGEDIKNSNGCNYQKGAAALDYGYPMLKNEWGNAGDTTVIYRGTIPGKNLGNVKGLNEASLRTGATLSHNTLAYAEITPPLNVTADDTLQVIWEIIINT
jgi:hypothetical protein